MFTSGKYISRRLSLTWERVELVEIFFLSFLKFMTNISCTNFFGGGRDTWANAPGDEGRTSISNMQPPKIGQFHMGKKMFVSSKIARKDE